MGVQVFDKSNDDFEELPDSNLTDEDYEVICVSETKNIPVREDEKLTSVLRHGTQFMMRQTTKLFGSLLSPK